VARQKVWFEQCIYFYTIYENAALYNVFILITIDLFICTSFHGLSKKAIHKQRLSRAFWWNTLSLLHFGGNFSINVKDLDEILKLTLSVGIHQRGSNLIQDQQVMDQTNF